MNRRLKKRFLTAGVMIALLATAACDPAVMSPGLSGPDTSGDPAPPPVQTLSQASVELTRYYRQVESDLLARGLLRKDGGGPDVPFTAFALSQNFDAIALSEEMRVENGRLLPGKGATQVHRWQAPVRVGLKFAETVPADVRRRDRDFVAAYLRRLSAATRHPIFLVNDKPNFNVLVMHEDQRVDASAFLQSAGISLSDGGVTAITNMRRVDYCVVLTDDSSDDGIITNATAVIRAEHPDLLRQVCYHEEIAQGLGLFNDSPLARPSIFNDDEEFGYLTTHDEMLLRILYDPRLRPGMSAAQARVTAEMIARTLTGGES